MMVRDTDTLVVKVTNSEGAIAAGLGVQWTSSDPAKLELRPLPPASTSRRASLEAQLGVQAIAHSRGTVIVRAVVDQPGIDSASFTDTVTILERWIAVSAGGGYSCALTIDNDAFCWGAANIIAGEPLGNGSIAGSEVPVPVLGGLKFSTIAAGDFQTCATSFPTGLLYCWGRNASGQLGTGTFDSELVPRPSTGSLTFVRVSTEDGVTCGVTRFLIGFVDTTSSNTLCWGRASLGSLGIGPLPSEAELCHVSRFGSLQERLCIPKVGTVVGQGFAGSLLLNTVSVGGEFACGIVIDARSISAQPGEAVCWGNNFVQQLGTTEILDECNLTRVDSSTVLVPCSLLPVRVGGGLSFTTLSSGPTYTCGITNTKKLYCWGLGYGLPAVVPGSESLEFDSVSVGGALESSELHACALTPAGQAYCWGDGSHGELGNGEATTDGSRIHHDELQKVLQDTLRFVSISAGGGNEASFNFLVPPAHTCALSRRGAIYCWGQDTTGALGNPSVRHSSVPVRIAEPSP